jgi:hypothetical protein
MIRVSVGPVIEFFPLYREMLVRRKDAMGRAKRLQDMAKELVQRGESVETRQGQNDAMRAQDAAHLPVLALQLPQLAPADLSPPPPLFQEVDSDTASTLDWLELLDGP